MRKCHTWGVCACEEMALQGGRVSPSVLAVFYDFPSVIQTNVSLWARDELWQSCCRYSHGPSEGLAVTLPSSEQWEHPKLPKMHFSCTLTGQFQTCQTIRLSPKTSANVGADAFLNHVLQSRMDIYWNRYSVVIMCSNWFLLCVCSIKVRPICMCLKTGVVPL